MLSLGNVPKGITIALRHMIVNKVEITNKPAYKQPQDTPNTDSTLDNMMKLPFDIYDLQIQPYQFYS